MTQVSKIEDHTAAPTTTDPMVSMIERVAMSPDLPIERLERMLAMKEKMDQQEAKAQFDAAFSRASAEFPDIPLNGENKHNKTKYALLKDILTGVRPVLSKYGLALSFSTEATADLVTVTAELSHQGGHSKRNSLPLPRDAGAGRNAVQAIGSSQTYGQRYTAQAILGLSLGDDTEDDGATAGKVQEQPKPIKDPWTHTILSELPDNATDRDKALAVAQALCAQWKRMKGERQLGNEWDRRAHLIEGERGLEARHHDLYATVVDGYENRRNAIIEERREQEQRGA